MVDSIRKNPISVSLAFVTLSFAMILADLALLGHTRGPQMTGIIACVLGIVLGAIALFAANLRKIVAILFLVLALTGLMGVLAHSGARGFRQQGAAAAKSISDDRTVQNALRSFANLPPTLAPLVLSGLALMGAAMSAAGMAVAVGKRK